MHNIIGKKSGMTRIFFDDGTSIPVTAIYIIDNILVNIKKNINNKDTIQITIADKRNTKINKSISVYLEKNKIKLGNKLWEFYNDINYKLSDIGKIIDLSLLKKCNKVNITGISKGKGFSGVIKRWNFKSQDASHGNSLSHRAPGSIGQNQSPGRVFKGKKMSGHYGNCKVTVKNLEIINFIVDKKILIIKGSVPGQIGSNLIIKPIK